jgi:hydrogenase maturation protease
MKRLLVIGYGNSLRRDDAAGRLVADTVASWGLPGVAARSTHQLVPELAEELSQTACVVFADATAEECEVQLRRLGPEAAGRFLNHACDPRGLLSLTDELYGVRPSAWLLTIPGHDFGFGERMSPHAQSNMTKALALIRSLLGREPLMQCAESAQAPLP